MQAMTDIENDLLETVAKSPSNYSLPSYRGGTEEILVADIENDGMVTAETLFILGYLDQG